ncbi:MAG: cytochrome b N-terminal domain-containing protein [Pseudomonadota bacterium]
MRAWLSQGWAFFEHLHAPRVRTASLRFRATLFGGLLSTILLAILIVTGLLLMYVYVPSEEGAWQSMRVLEERVRFGGMLRALHNWAAQAMLITATLHLVSLTARGAFIRKKALNWWIGVALFLLTVALSYTGYLLPWDQLAYWAVTVGAHMAGSAPLVGAAARHALLGADEIGGTTLLRFYTHHCVTLPLLFGLLIGVHLYRIRRDGGLSLSPAAEAREAGATTTSRGAILRWELWIAALITLLGVLLAAWWPIPLGPEADPSLTPNPMKAPWYLVGLQELLHFHPAFAVTYLVPAAGFGALLVLPLLPERIQGASLASLPRWGAAVLHAGFTTLALVSTPLVAWHTDLTVILACGLGALALALARGPLRATLGRLGLPLFLLGWTLTAYLGLVAVALWLRGPGWSLLWIP